MVALSPVSACAEYITSVGRCAIATVFGDGSNCDYSNGVVVK